jgi:glycyl-tRNA synthetase beta subunit
MKQAQEILVEFVLDRLPQETADKKIEMYRVLAVLAPTRAEATQFNERADYWERGAAGDRQLLLNFKRRVRG